MPRSLKDGADALQTVRNLLSFCFKLEAKRQLGDAMSEVDSIQVQGTRVRSSMLDCKPRSSILRRPTSPHSQQMASRKRSKPSLGVRVMWIRPSQKRRAFRESRCLREAALMHDQVGFSMSPPSSRGYIMLILCCILVLYRHFQPPTCQLQL